MCIRDSNTSEVTVSFTVLPDTTLPEFDSIPNGLSDITCYESLPVQETLTASDSCGSVTVVPSVDPYTVDVCAGYEVVYRWTATDDCSNTSEVTVSFTVLPDTTLPEFDSIPNGLSDITCYESLPLQETLTASDSCGSVTVVPSVDPYTVDICNGYTVVYRWTATDDCSCLLYTSPSPRDATLSRMPSSA